MKQAVSRGLIGLTLGLALCAFAGAVFAQSDSEGDAKPAGSDWVSQTTQTCAGCHGKNGVSQTDNFPVIAGQYQNYLLHSLKAYRDGERKNGIMSGQVQGMTNDQLKALAHYFSTQESPLHTPSID